MSFFNQHEYDIRFEWGLSGVDALMPVSDVMIIVDVLSFTTCVDIILGRGGVVFPYRGDEENLAPFALEVDALVASKKCDHAAAYTLAPTSLLQIPQGTRLVLPSPNGSTLSLATGHVPTLAGCLRNARAVAKKAMLLGKRISVIAAGERWWSTGLLRPSLEDLLGAGAILSELDGERSPEAETAVISFQHAQHNLPQTLLRCGSGKELVGRGFADDVALAAQLNASQTAPVLTDGAYQNSH